VTRLALIDAALSPCSGDRSRADAAVARRAQERQAAPRRTTFPREAHRGRAGTAPRPIQSSLTAALTKIGGPAWAGRAPRALEDLEKSTHHSPDL